MKSVDCFILLEFTSNLTSCSLSINPLKIRSLHLTPHYLFVTTWKLYIIHQGFQYFSSTSLFTGATFS